MTQRTQEAIDVFLDALNEGTLAKGSCTACAVGNLAAFGMGVKIKKFDGVDNVFYCDKINNINNYDWNEAFVTNFSTQMISEKHFDLPIFKYFKFTPLELSKIENAFERNTTIPIDLYYRHSKKVIRKDQIKGLEAVVKVMLQLDKNIEETYQEVFTSRALTLVI